MFGLGLTALALTANVAPAAAWRHVSEAGHGDIAATSAFRSLKNYAGLYGSEGETPSELTDVDPPIAKFFQYPGHPNDGNEGNEGNEGDEGNEGGDVSESEKPSEETDVDPPNAKTFQYPGHPNDGNEGNEGNEGDEGNEGGQSEGEGRYPGYLARPGYDHPNDGDEGNEGNEGKKL